MQVWHLFQIYNFLLWSFMDNEFMVYY